MHSQSRWLALALVIAGLSCDLYAVDGIVLIDQNRALAGGVTPGDAPGFPVTISVAGSYRLSGSLRVPDANTTAILISAHQVKIDLNGFSISGPTVCTGSPVTACSPTGPGVGILDDTNHTDVTVVNGDVYGMGKDGVQLTGYGGSVERVHANSNGYRGIYVFNRPVSGNSAQQNGSTGIYTEFSAVSGNTASLNGENGIYANRGTVAGNVTLLNHGSGIFVLCPSSVVGNTSVENAVLNLAINGANCAVANNAAP